MKKIIIVLGIIGVVLFSAICNANVIEPNLDFDDEDIPELVNL